MGPGKRLAQQVSLGLAPLCESGSRGPKPGETATSLAKRPQSPEQASSGWGTREDCGDLRPCRARASLLCPTRCTGQALGAPWAAFIIPSTCTEQSLNCFSAQCTWGQMGPHPTPGLPCLGSERGMEEGREFRMKPPSVPSISQVPIPFVALSVSPVSLPTRTFRRTDRVSCSTSPA